MIEVLFVSPGLVGNLFFDKSRSIFGCKAMSGSTMVAGPLDGKEQECLSPLSFTSCIVRKKLQ